MKCTVTGCRNKLDETGTPIEYCDFQQGRCPMQRQHLPRLTIIQEAMVFFAVVATAVGMYTLLVFAR